MTPAEHLAEAERLLDQSYGQVAAMEKSYARELVGKAIGHALVAVAAELGVPHDGTTAGGAAGAVPQAGS